MKKFTKLSLVAALALSTSAFGATVSGTMTAYSLDEENTAATHDVALTLKVSEKLNDNISVNATIVSVEGFDTKHPIQNDGTLTTEANVVATYANTTVKAGRQYIESPMFYSFDWKMKPIAYQATALINTDIANTTLVAVDAQRWTSDNTKMTFDALDGKNRAYGAVYSVDGYSAQAWYYDIEAYSTDYTQTYLDATKSFGDIEVTAQYIDTNAAADSQAYGIKVSTKVAGFDITVAAADVNDASGAYYVGGDSMVTSMWNSFAIEQGVGTSSMISASTELAGVSITTAYADYTDGFETNLITEYAVSEKVGLTAVYTDTDTEHALEVMATYSF
jgi:hypothetical protein